MASANAILKWKKISNSAQHASQVIEPEVGHLISYCCILKIFFFNEKIPLNLMLSTSYLMRTIFKNVHNSSNGKSNQNLLN